MTMDHEELERWKGRGNDEREVEMVTTPDKRDKWCDNLILAFFWQTGTKAKGTTL
jgi:hypothetical protein